MSNDAEKRRIKEIIRRRAKKITDAKNDNISRSIEMGVENFLEKNVRELMSTYKPEESEVWRFFFLKKWTEGLVPVVTSVDPGAKIEMLWHGGEDDKDFMPEGVVVTWSKEIALKRGQDELRIDSSYLLLKDLGITR